MSVETRPRVLVTADYAEMSRVAADLAAKFIAAVPDMTIVPATGETPIEMYRELARRNRHGSLDTSRLRVFQLDAYVGIAPNDPRSLYRWMDREVLQPLAIGSDRVVALRGDAADPAEECRRYVAAVHAAGGIGLAVLGLGPNGHLGFNEPPSGPTATTRVVELTPASIDSGARYWGSPNRVPPRAMTAGMDLLLEARRTLLVVSGERKRDILARALDGPLTPEVPASYLRLAREVTVVADRAARP